ncbi:phosphatidylinositol 4-phosphate 5-kinase 8 [Tanacetum coccineum]
MACPPNDFSARLGIMECPIQNPKPMSFFAPDEGSCITADNGLKKGNRNTNEWTKNKNSSKGQWTQEEDRKMFKLDAADYMMSICGDDGLTELSSLRKSGSMFQVQGIVNSPFREQHVPSSWHCWFTKLFILQLNEHYVALLPNVCCCYYR